MYKVSLFKIDSFELKKKVQAFKSEKENMLYQKYVYDVLLLHESHLRQFKLHRFGHLPFGQNRKKKDE